MGWFSKNNDPELEDMKKAMDKRSRRYVILCDEFNKNFKPGDFIRYWYNSEKKRDSSFGFITEPAVYEETVMGMSISDVRFKFLNFTLYGKANQYSYPYDVRINNEFHAEKSSQEDFVKYKKMKIQSSIDDAKENMKRLREIIKRQNTERNNINNFLKANWLIVTENLKKHIKNNG